MANTDLTKLLPKQNRDKTIDTLIRALFNRHLTKDESELLYGFIGAYDVSERVSSDIYLTERDLERQVNWLEPVVYAKNATEERGVAWAELLQKLLIMGVPYEQINQWLTTDTLNLIPPIDLDKFSNFNEYYWVGQWLLDYPSLPYEALGIPKAAALEALARSNTKATPEYYVIERGGLDASNNPVPATGDMASWSDWALCNLWVHRDEALAFQSSYNAELRFSTLVNAKLPIIEYAKELKLNTQVNLLGEPVDANGIERTSLKHTTNQPPLFDLYTHDGVHAKLASAIFYYKESTDAVVDSRLGRRLTLDDNSDFVFGLGIKTSSSDELLWFKLWEGTEYKLHTVWRGSDAQEAAEYVKYDSTGTLINHDKFENFANYYWDATVDSSLPSYNPTASAEYYVIETGGSSAWSADNRWVHVSSIKKADLAKYVQAKKPIIEYNLALEAELRTAKTTYNQVPCFNLYMYDDSSQGYVLVPDELVVDAYTMGCLVARLEDMPLTKAAITASSDLSSQLFTYSGALYVQSFVNGYYSNVTSSNVTYGFTSQVVDRSSTGNGQLTVDVTGTTIPQVLKLVALSENEFSVTGSVSTNLPTLAVGTPYTVAGTVVTLLAGSIAFAVGDEILLNIRSNVFNSVQLYAKVDGSYRSFSAVDGILTKDEVAMTLVDATPSKADGVWAVPAQLKWNTANETRTTLGHGDLVTHFVDVIGSQVGITGSANGRNNWRNLAVHDFGLGGTIKQFNGRFNLLVSLLMQEGLTVPSLLEFSRKSYAEMLGHVKEFVENEFIHRLVAGTAKLPVNGELDTSTKASLIEYLERSSSVYDSEVLTAVNNIYYDTTMPIKALAPTLPYMGLVKPTQPQVMLDNEQNLTVLRHHDGHTSVLATVADSVTKNAVLLKFTRSNGQATGGTVAGSIPPTTPFAKQLWLDLTKLSLYFYNVYDDQGTFPTDPAIGDFAYNRATGEVWRFNGRWVALGADQVAQEQPWAKIDLTAMLQAAYLAIERELFDSCAVPTRDLVSLGKANEKHATLMQREYEAFAAKYGLLDPYASSYSATNAFTWNYTGTSSSFISAIPATWHQIYKAVYGTTRPDLEPWVTLNTTETALIAELITQGLLPSGTTKFALSMWPAIASYMRAHQAALGKPARLSVDPSTGALLAPYAFGAAEQLFDAMPPNPLLAFEFGDEGPYELMWSRTDEHLTSVYKVAYLLDPLSFVGNTWGDEVKKLNGYEFSRALGRKQAPADIPLHGTTITDPAFTVDSVSITSSTTPDYDVAYSLTVAWVDSYTNEVLVKITCDDPADAINADASARGVAWFATYDDNASIVLDKCTLALARPKTGFNVGDSINVSLGADGSATALVSAAIIQKLPGLSQLYVQHHRYYGADTQLAANTTWLQGWETKLAYRAGTFVDTDTLKIQVEDTAIDSSAYSVILKETPFISKANITGFKVTLLQVGSTERNTSGSLVPAKPANGQRGDDWVFRLDSFLPSNTNIQWYQLDTTGAYQTFFALNAKNSLDEWKHYTGQLSLVSAKAPFVVTGLQNLVTFLYGYAARAQELGFVFNGTDNPLYDSTTNRQVDWQLQIEQVVNQQFLGVEAGSAFVIAPFANRMWFKTTFGYVANLDHPAAILGELVPALYDAAGQRMTKDQFRVFRDDELTEISFMQPAYAATILTSSHEHLVLFEQYTGLSTLLYDAFLGQRVSRLFLSGSKQASPNGRIAYGGKFLVNGTMRRNIESSLQNVLQMYDTSNAQLNASDVEHARALLGFETKDYWRDRSAPTQTEFRFWQGAIKSKGTNSVVDAYVNSSSYSTASLDEYWAYKVAEYGDARSTVDVELKVEPSDCTTERTNYLLLEADEQRSLGSTTAETVHAQWATYLAANAKTIESYDPRGALFVQPDDEDRWYRYSDLSAMSSFPATVTAELTLTPTDTETVYYLTGSDGKPVNADAFEVVDLTAIQGSDLYDALPYDTVPYGAATNQVYREPGEYISGTSPAQYEAPKFKRISASAIQFTDNVLVDRPVKVRCYAPPLAKYSPSRLYTYKTAEAQVKSDLIWWDPARGVHHPEAYTAVDYEASRDPARYNVSGRTFGNSSADGLRAWAVNQVGKVWWDTTDLAWVPYHDTKVFPSLQERLARWGSLADYSTINVYEWVEADVVPSSYAADGEPAIVETLYRDRTWYQRPVAWLSSSNPQLIDRAPAAMQGAKLVPVLTDGVGTLVVDAGTVPTLTAGMLLSAALYSSTTRSSSELVKPIGLYEVTSDSTAFAVGSSTDFTTPIIGDTSYFTSPKVTIDTKVVSYFDSIAGKLTFEYELSGTTYYVRATYATGKTQRVEISTDTPVNAGSTTSLVFDQIGLTLTLTATYGQADAWGLLGTTTATQRKQLLAASIGAAGTDFVLREGIAVVEKIAPMYDDGTAMSYLPGADESSLYGWVAWSIPTTLSTDSATPYNKYEPVYGSWTLVGSKLASNVDAIKQEQTSPTKLQDGTKVLSYKSEWAPWKKLADTTIEACYYTTTARNHDLTCKALFSTTGSVSGCKVYVNGLRTLKFTTETVGSVTTIYPDTSVLQQGALVHIVVPAYVPTATDLAYDPTKSSADPTVLRMYKTNTPYTIVMTRNEYGRVASTKYYYWVKNKAATIVNKDISIKRVAELLSEHDDMYCVPQAFKFYNQLDARANRYSMLSVKNMAQYVRKSGEYKLRLQEVSSMRHDDSDTSLKNIHSEWKLIRANQATRIPKELWDKLTDTLCGETATGQSLPYVPYASYDSRNPSSPSAGYGIGDGQLMTDPAEAKATVKGTIVNTKVTIYDATSGTMVSDPISYTGFDVNNLDAYLASTDTIRAFMGDVWRLAKPKQINELFFAVLEDTMAKTKELSGIFKTSFVSLNEVRTVAS